MLYKCSFGVLFTSDYHRRKTVLTCLPQKGLNCLAWLPGIGCPGERHVPINSLFWVIAKVGKKYHKPTCHAYLAPFWTFTQSYMPFHLGEETDNRNRNVSDFFICLYTKFCFPQDSGSQTRGHNFIAHSSVFFSWHLVLSFFLGCFSSFPGFIVTSSVKFSDLSALIPQTCMLLSKTSKQFEPDL